MDKCLSVSIINQSVMIILMMVMMMMQLESDRCKCNSLKCHDIEHVTLTIFGKVEIN